MRLWDDSARELAVARYGPTGSVGRKLVVHGVPEALRAHAPAPLDAIYLLTGAAPDGEPPAARRQQSPRAAALALVRQATAGGLLGGAEGARLLQRASAVARLVPVYVLDVVRDFQRLDDVAAMLNDWSTAACASPTAVEAGASA